MLYGRHEAGSIQAGEGLISALVFKILVLEILKSIREVDNSTHGAINPNFLCFLFSALYRGPFRFFLYPDIRHGYSILIVSFVSRSEEPVPVAVPPKNFTSAVSLELELYSLKT